ncbi:MAG: hypothetical protein ACR2OR_07840 [Hyphomicrobiales bacterium]
MVNRAWTFCTVVAAIAVFCSSAYAQNAASGRDLARLHCSRCHVMPDLNNMGIGSTPSFKIMVLSKAEDWRAKFEAFFSLPPHPAFVTIKELRTQRQGPSPIAPVILSLRDVDDLMAYVDELAAEYRGK